MSDAVTLALCGDLMIGRGVDQVLPDPCPPTLHEEYVQNANDYVALAERASGTIPRPVDLAYPWGDSLDELEEIQPDAWIVNLETALTRSDRPWRGKAVNYRASPQNARMLAAGGVDCCALANNHVLDWGREGLTETIATLDGLGVRHAGAGADRAGAEAPAELGLDDGTRVLVFSLATTSSGVPKDWVASGRRPGVALIADLSEGSRAEIIQRVRSHRRGGDILVISIHWGGNWDFEVPPQQ
ncbi:MAG: CapA family protein, partial [Thermoleophilia bacterium]|nr:CapA family protein [Thermoleophilia bacterium]